MQILVASQFGFCSPNVLDFYTFKFPQRKRVSSWWQVKGSFYQNDPASPQTALVSLAQNNYKILVISTEANFLDSYLDNINEILKDYQQIQQLIISRQSTIDEYFEKMMQINASTYDFIMLDFIHCGAIRPPQEKNETLYDRTNKFYLYKNWTDIPHERVQSLEQIQQIQSGYQKFNSQKLIQLDEYFSFQRQQISGRVPLFLTSVIDTTSSLLFNSVSFCHVSPLGQIQSSSTNCKIAIPIGMETSGINGKGHVGIGFQFLLKFLSQLNSCHDNLLYLYSILHESSQIKQQNLQQLYGSPFGLTNFVSIQKMKQLYQLPEYTTEKDIISCQNVKNGDTLYLDQFRVFQIQFTVRGHEDVFLPIYENNFKTSLINNQEDMKIFEGINIFICQKGNNYYIPKLIGKVQERNGFYEYIIQSSLYSNSQLSDNILIWYSYSQDQKAVQQEIQLKQMINTTMVTSLQIIGSIVPMTLFAISDIRNVTEGVKLYFTSNATYVYIACYRLNEVNITAIVTDKIGQLHIISLNLARECNLYFCASQYDLISLLNQNCAKSEEFNVLAKQMDQIMFVFIVFGVIWILFQLMSIQFIKVKISQAAMSITGK